MNRGDCLWPAMYRGDLPVRTTVRGPVRSGTHFFGIFLCEAACLRLFAATAARRINPATDAAGGASSGPCERVNPQLTGRRILEVAPYGYNLYSNPHESTAFPHATGSHPVAVCHRPRSRTHVIVERNGQHRPSFRDGPARLGQCRGER